MTNDLISRKALEDLQEPAYNESHYVVDRVVSINAIRRLPTINAIVIPDNATNGDVFKSIFKFSDEEEPYDFCDWLEWNQKSWWNAPYKKEE